MGALLSPMMGAWGEGGAAAADEGPKLKERAFIPDAWDDSDEDDDDATEGGEVTTETESATVKGSTNSRLDWRTTRGTRKMTTGGLRE